MHYGKKTPYDIKRALCGLVTTLLVIIVGTPLNFSCPSPFKVDFQELMLNKTLDTNIGEKKGNHKCICGTTKTFTLFFSGSVSLRNYDRGCRM